MRRMCVCVCVCNYTNLNPKVFFFIRLQLVVFFFIINKLHTYTIRFTSVILRRFC